MIAFETYIDDGSEATTVLVHPDAQSEDFHVQVAAQTLQPLYEFLDFTKMSIGVYGRPSERVLEQMTELAQSGVTLSLKTNYVGGSLTRERRCAMKQPFIYVGTYQIKEGKRDDFARYWRDFVEFVEASEPRLIAFNAYVNEDGNEVAIVQLHPDGDSMEFHMKVIREHMEHAAWEFLGDVVSEHVYGVIGESTLETMRQFGGSAMEVKPLGVGGFTRSAAEPTAVRS